MAGIIDFLGNEQTVVTKAHIHYPFENGALHSRRFLFELRCQGDGLHCTLFKPDHAVVPKRLFGVTEKQEVGETIVDTGGDVGRCNKLARS